MRSIDVALVPAELDAASKRPQSVCIVLDVVRATSSIVAALAHGAACVVPIESIPRARWLKGVVPEAILVGEEGGLKPNGFDLGNSPSQFASPALKDKTILMATTNGTKAVLACVGFREVYVGSLLNFSATVDAAAAELKSGAKSLVIVCAGTRGRAAWEDVVAAGAFAGAITTKAPWLMPSDSAMAASSLYKSLNGKPSLAPIFGAGQNGHRLRQLGLGRDIDWCAQIDRFPVVAKVDRTRRFPAVVLSRGHDPRG